MNKLHFYMVPILKVFIYLFIFFILYIYIHLRKYKRNTNIIKSDFLLKWNPPLRSLVSNKLFPVNNFPR